MNELRSLLTTPDLDRHVVRLHLDLTVSLSEESEVERILRDLQGTDATHGRAGVLVVDRTGMRLQVGSGDAFPDDLPPVLKDTVAASIGSSQRRSMSRRNRGRLGRWRISTNCCRATTRQVGAVYEAPSAAYHELCRDRERGR
jgi:hypothetical protein